MLTFYFYLLHVFNNALFGVALYKDFNFKMCRFHYLLVNLGNFGLKEGSVLYHNAIIGHKVKDIEIIRKETCFHHFCL